MIQSTRYTGKLSEVQKLIIGSKADKAKLVDMLNEQEDIQGQIEEAERLLETLPTEIDKLLKSGRIDNETVDTLARKRSHLDLIPARLEYLQDQLNRQETEEDVQLVEEVIHKAAILFYEIQLKKAVGDLKRLDADEELAKQQALIRPDIQFMHPSRISAQYTVVGNLKRKLRSLLWCFEAFEEGVHPICSNAAEIKQKWLPGE